MRAVVPPTALPGYGTDVWRGSQPLRDIPALSTGHASLDRILPGGGWPLGALTELLTANPGSGEFSLLLPVLAGLTSRGQWAILIDPPWVPYAPALRGHGIDLQQVLVIRSDNDKDSFWACEQALRGVRGGAVLAWPEHHHFTRLRRLQLAARSGAKPAFIFSPSGTAEQSSPAALRLRLDCEPHGTRITVVKCRGRKPNREILLRTNPYQPGIQTPPDTPARPPGPADTAIPRAPEPPGQHVH